MEHADDFLDAHADVVLYSGQDAACASKPSLGQHVAGTACAPCAELPPVVDGASICAEEQAPRFEPCLTRITVKVCYGGEELVLTTDQMCATRCSDDPGDSRPPPSGVPIARMAFLAVECFVVHV